MKFTASFSAEGLLEIIKKHKQVFFLGFVMVFFTVFLGVLLCYVDHECIKKQAFFLSHQNFQENVLYL